MGAEPVVVLYASISVLNWMRAATGSQCKETNGAFPLHDTSRLVTARLSSGRFAFPLQFSNALEWAGLFMCRYSGAASTAVTSS